MVHSKVFFYALNQKFLDTDKNTPENTPSRQVMYYSLAIGHHVGVIDCFKKTISCNLEQYCSWIGKLTDSQAKRKMEGLLKFGEITIDRTHTHLLKPAFEAIRETLSDEQKQWTDRLLQSLASMEIEPAFYMMVKLVRETSR